jgi:transposase-like protein
MAKKDKQDLLEQCKLIKKYLLSIHYSYTLQRESALFIKALVFAHYELRLNSIGANHIRKKIAIGTQKSLRLKSPQRFLCTNCDFL